MTVADNTSRNQYTATSGQTVFAYTFEIVDKDDIVVLKNGTTLSEGTNYTVSNVGNDSGGNVTLTAGATAGDILTLYRDMPYARTQNYTNSGDFLASEVNSDFDNLWLAGEQTNRSFSQSIRKPITDSDSISMELPEAANRTNSFLTFDSTGAVSVESLSGANTPTSISRQQFTGNGSTTVFTLAADPGSPAAVVIYIDGVYQEGDTYSISGTSLTFTEAPPINASIEAVLYRVTDIGATDANSVTYLPAGTGAVQTTVQTKLRESVSVKDFGAVGDGVTDDTAAIQAAVIANPGKTIFFPQGNYLVSSTIDLTGLRVRLAGDGTAYGVNKGSKIIFTSTSSDLFNCEQNYYFTVRDMGFDGDPNATQSTTNRCFVINDITHILFENVTITGFNDGIVQDPSSGNIFHLTLNQCNINDCYYALYINQSCHLITIANSFISNNGFGIRIKNSANVSIQSTAIQIQGMNLARGREEAISYNFRFDGCSSVGFDNCYFEVNAFDVVGSPATPGTQYMGQINDCNGFNFKNCYVVGSTAMDATVNLFQFSDTAGISFEGNYFYRFNTNMTLASGNATGNQNRHLISRSSNVVNSTMKVIDNSYPPVLYLNNAEPTSPAPVYGAGNTGRTFFDGTNFRYVGTMIVTNWAALVAAGSASDYIGIKVPTAIDVASHGSLDQVAIGSGFWNGAGVLINAIEDSRPNIIRVKVNGWGTNLTSGDAPTYISFDITYQPEILPT